MHLGELPRPQLVIRVVPAPVVAGAQRNSGQIRRLLAQPVLPGVGRLDTSRPVAYRTGEGPDPLEVSRTSDWLHVQLLLNECRPMARPAPGTSAPPSIAALIDRLSTLTSGLLTCSRTAERCSISSPSSNRSHVTAGSFSRSIRYSAGMADSSVTSTDGGHHRPELTIKKQSVPRQWMAAPEGLIGRRGAARQEMKPDRKATRLPDAVSWSVHQPSPAVGKGRKE